jgi:hypothetical protein
MSADRIRRYAARHWQLLAETTFCTPCTNAA